MHYKLTGSLQNPLAILVLCAKDLVLCLDNKSNFSQLKASNLNM